MANENELFTCYNKGCGKKFDPNSNPSDACRYHSGEPFFHDAYKGWSCCNKKCTDFTEFLNIPGCTVSKHSSEKPPEVEKPLVKDSNPEEVIEVKPIVAPTLQRPPFDTPMVTLKPELAPSLKQMQTSAAVKTVSVTSADESSVTIGTSCKNGGCNKSYEGEQSDGEVCVFHPGSPVFHEGLKFWSCCQKRTSDFNAFLNQEGCQRGAHVWFKKENDTTTVTCRWDWHQTGNNVVVTVYAKQYCPEKSVIKINPIRIYVELLFPQEGNFFKMDLELCGIVDVTQSQLCMFGTKVEIKLKKAEPGSWSKLNFPQKAPEVVKSSTEGQTQIESLTPQIDAVDLSDL